MNTGIAIPAKARATRASTTIVRTLAAAGAATLGVHAGAQVQVPVPDPIFTSNELLGEAKPEECFNGVGVDYPPINPDGTCDVGEPKTNESYIWGLTEESGKLFFGTIANAACLTAGGDIPGAPTEDAQTREYICEFGESELARRFPAIPDGVGDWRPPSIYEYDLATDQLRKRDDVNDPLLTMTLGFRGAGSIDNIAFLGGKDLFGMAANIFAFEADTGAYLGSCQLTQYVGIRQWVVADGVLYVGAGTSAVGSVLRWTGDRQSFPGNFCDDFVEVGRVEGNAGSLAVYTGGDGRNRLAVSTGPSDTVIGVWISPPLGPDGLDPADADHWVKVWDPTVYDPDRIVAARGYLGGAMHSFGGWLYWGTMQPASVKSQRTHKNCTQPFCFGQPADPQEEQALQAGVFRTSTLWRGRNLESSSTREIQLLYGETELPACHEPHSFESTPTGWTPLYGRSGFGNRRNAYVWQMTELNGHLFVGTYDATPEGVETGADLWRFDSPDAPAVNEGFSGFGDPNNYGFRAMIGLDDRSALVVGLANAFNISPGGGWELRRLREAP